MINLEKIKKEKCQPLPFKKTCPCTIFLPLFKKFSDPPPPLGEVFKVYFPFKNEGFKLCTYYALLA